MAAGKRAMRAWVVPSACAFGACDGEAPSSPAPSQVAAGAPSSAPPAAPRGVWYEAPRSGDPDFTIVNGRDGAGARFMLELMGSGVALVDYDRDGDLDLFFVVGTRYDPPGDDASDRLFRNRGDGTFEDVTDAAGVRDAAHGFGVAVGDYDRDGFDDLFVANWGPDRLLRNRGDGTFEDATARAGVADDGWSTSAAFGDADGDGDLDLYVCRYFRHDREHPPEGGRLCPFLDLQVPCGPQWLPAERDLFWRNEGDGTFTEASEAAGMRAVRPSYGLGLTWCDVDDDGQLDLYVCNDSLPHFVFRNCGGGRFEEVGALSGLAVRGDGHEQAGMGVDCADWSGDGREDFVVTCFSADYDTLYENQGELCFEDATQRRGLAEVGWWTLGWGTRLFDADCDGDLDLFVANGHVYPTIDGRSSMTYAERNELCLQGPDGRFTACADEAGPGLALVKPSRGAAFGDLDGDGWIDLVVSERNQAPSILRAVAQPGVHRLQVELRPGPDQRPVDHSLVTLRAGGRTLVRRMNRGGSYCSSSDPRVHFGLGATPRVDELSVRWPDGAVTVLRDLPADVRVTLARDAPAAPAIVPLREVPR